MKHFAVFVSILLVVLFVTACGITGKTGDYKSFPYKLQGTWVSNEPSVYSGTLTITYSSITITGYTTSQNPVPGDDTQRPFKDFLRDTPLKGYAEEESPEKGKIFIDDFGTMEELPYTYYEDGIYPPNKFLRFNFGGRTENVKYQSN